MQITTGPSFLFTILMIIENSFCDSCCQTSDRRVCNCSNQQLAEFKPSLLPRDLSSITVLLLDNNVITSLDPDVFLAMEHLEQLSLARNRVTELEPGVFDSLNSLRELVLNDNRLTTIKTGTLDNQENLLTLYLNNNRLSAIQPEAFSGLIRLRELYLQSNALKRLDVNIFPKNTFLVALYLNNNQMRCDCGMIEFYHWIKTRSLMFMAKCDSPENLRGRYMVDVYANMINCSKRLV